MSKKRKIYTYQIDLHSLLLNIQVGNKNNHRKNGDKDKAITAGRRGERGKGKRYKGSGGEPSALVWFMKIFAPSRYDYVGHQTGTWRLVNQFTSECDMISREQ